jgi:hypothetical protein
MLSTTGAADRLDELRNAESLLDGAFADRAKSFVAAGDELVKAVAAFQGLSTVFNGLSDALSNTDMRDGLARLEEVARDCSEIHDLIPCQLNAMDNLSDANGNIGKRLEQLRANIRIVACIAINARIEASGLKAHSQDMLTFTYDVAKLATTAEGTIDQYGTEQRRANDVLQNARNVLTQFAIAHSTQLKAIAAEIATNLHSVEQRRTVILAEASRIGARAGEITASIGKIITALQIADITSQRLSHVHEAASLLIEGLSSEGNGNADQWWHGLDAWERQQVAAKVAALQIAQIDHTLVDLDAETLSIRKEVAGLAEEAVAMTRDGRHLYGSGEDASQSFLGTLAGRIQLASELLSDCQRAFGRLSELNRSVGNSFSALHDQAASLQGIMGVVRGVRLIGLNAHLKSDGLGHEGRTLSAISRELRSSADLISVHARDLIKSIDDTLAEFEIVKTHSGSVSASRLQSLVDGMGQALFAFETGGTSLADALTSLTREGSSVCDALAAACEVFERTDDLTSRLGAARGVLQRMAAAPFSEIATRWRPSAMSICRKRRLARASARAARPWPSKRSWTASSSDEIRQRALET